MLLLADPQGPVSVLVAERLHALGHPVAGLARNEGEAHALRARGLGTVLAAPTDGRALRRSLRGVTRILLEGRPVRGQSAVHRRLIDAAAQARVPHIVRLSPFGADPDADSLYLQRQGELDARLEAGPLRATILSHHLYTQDLLGFADQVRAEHRIIACMGGAPAYIDARDAAEVAVVALTRSAMAHERYELTGPHAVGLADLAAMIGRVVKAPVRAHDVTPDEMRAFLAEEGVPPDAIEARIGVYQAYAHGPTPPTNAVQRLTGLSPRTVEGFVLAHADRFAGARAGWVLPERHAVKALEQPLSW